MKIKKAILYPAPTPPPYMGPSIATEILLKSKFTQEYEVIHIETSDRRSLSFMGKISITNIFVTLKIYVVFLTKFLFKKIDVVYILICQTRMGYLRDFPFLLLSKLFRKKLVLHLRGSHFKNFYDSSGKFMKWIIKKSFLWVDRMIVLGISLKPIFEELIPPEKIWVVPNGLDIYKDNLTKKTTRNNFRVLFLSNLKKNKGFQDVLFSTKKIIEKHKSVIFTFAGPWIENTLKIESENFINKYKLANYIEFTGSISGEQKINLLFDSDILVLPSYNEGHPWVIVEAMAAGLPIIATDVGCIAESVLDGKNGFIVPKNSPNAIAEKIIHLIEHPDEKVRMGRKSRELHKAHYTQERFVENMIEVFRSIP